MASYTTVSVGSGSPTLVFSGVGNLLIKTVNEHVYLGDNSVSNSNGMKLLTSYQPVSLTVTSPDDIYAISDGATATVQVYHNL